MMQREGLHGLGSGTTYPQAIGLGETWIPRFCIRFGATMVVRSPLQLPAQQPRWWRSRWSRRRRRLPDHPGAQRRHRARHPLGRTEECYGEDPFLNGTLAVAFIKGMQGDDPNTGRPPPSSNTSWPIATRRAVPDHRPISMIGCSMSTIPFPSALGWVEAARFVSWRRTTPGIRFL